MSAPDTVTRGRGRSSPLRSAFGSTGGARSAPGASRERASFAAPPREGSVRDVPEAEDVRPVLSPDDAPPGCPPDDARRPLSAAWLPEPLSEVGQAKASGGGRWAGRPSVVPSSIAPAAPPRS